MNGKILRIIFKYQHIHDTYNILIVYTIPQYHL